MHLLANVVPDGWKKCREVIDEHPYLARDEYTVDCPDAGKLSGLYTGENGLHIVRASPWLPRGGLVHVPAAHQRAWLSLCRRPPHGRRS